MIGWYVHAHGRGHLQRLQCVAAHLRTPVTALSSLPRPDGWTGGWVDLPDDLPTGADRDPTAGGTLHWAPLGHTGFRERTAAIAAWVTQARPALVVVDVSVEVAVLVRALGFPVLRVRHHGILGRVEIAAEDLGRALAREETIVAAVRAAGYAHAVIDREPFRSGRLNAVLRRPA